MAHPYPKMQLASFKNDVICECLKTFKKYSQSKETEGITTMS